MNPVSVIARQTRLFMYVDVCPFRGRPQGPTARKKILWPVNPGNSGLSGYKDVKPHRRPPYPEGLLILRRAPNREYSNRAACLRGTTTCVAAQSLPRSRNGQDGGLGKPR
jgi:hypothetical protein